MNKKLELLKKLKKAHDVYLISSKEQRWRLFEACSSLIDELFDLGEPRMVSEALLMYADEPWWKEKLERAQAAGDIF